MGVAQKSKATTVTTTEAEPTLLDQAIENTFQFSTDPSELIYDREKFDQAYRFAELVAQQSILPKHLSHVKVKNEWTELTDAQKTANCFRVVNQASRWGVDPFAIIDLTYVVGGKLGYEGKLVAGIINAKGGLESPLDYTFTGSDRERTVTVTGVINGEPKTVDLKYADAVTVGNDGKDSAQWTRDPDQKLIYSGVMKWARRWKPEVLLGILTDDDLHRIETSEASKPKPRRRRRTAVTQGDNLTSESDLNGPAGPAEQAEKKPAEAKPPAEKKPASKPKTAATEKKMPTWFVGLEAALVAADDTDDVQAIYDDRIGLCESKAAREKLADLCDARGEQFPKSPTAFDLEAARAEIGKADTVEQLNVVKARWLPVCKEDDEFNLDKLIDSRVDDISEARGEAS